MPTIRIVPRLLEFIGLFLLIPTLFITRIIPVRPIPVLIIVAVITGLILYLDRDFERQVLFARKVPRAVLKLVLIRFLISAVLLGVFTVTVSPESLFELIKNRPHVWLVVMIAYPILSVYPQELIFRTFLFHRYRALFPSDRLRIIASALAFGLVHLLYGNWIALVLSTVAGVFLADTYTRYRSLLLVSLEHAMYGQLIFTIGLGRYFYSGAIQ